MENPLLESFEAAMATSADLDASRSELIARYSFAVPTSDALDAIARATPEGVIEIGAGTGYWAYALRRHGVDVQAFDLEPAPSGRNAWFAGVPPWHPVHEGGHEVAGRFPRRTLLIVWPTKNESWAADALECYFDAGGGVVAYVGEGPGGRTGDEVFHALLGEAETCIQCTYGTSATPCICGVAARWRRVESIPLPHWPGYRDDLHIYARGAAGRSGRWRGAVRSVGNSRTRRRKVDVGKRGRR